MKVVARTTSKDDSTEWTYTFTLLMRKGNPQAWVFGSGARMLSHKKLIPIATVVRRSVTFHREAIGFSCGLGHKTNLREIFIAGGELEHFETVRLSGVPVTGDATVSVGELRISKGARKLYEAGLLALKQQRWTDARDDFRKVIAKFPRFTGAYNGLGVSLAETHEQGAAKDAFREDMRLEAHLQEAYVNLADLLLRAGRPCDAQATAEALLTFAPANVEGISDLVAAEFKQGMFEDVNRVVDRVHQGHVRHRPSLHDYAAQSYRSQGMDRDAAKEIFLWDEESHAETRKESGRSLPQEN